MLVLERGPPLAEAHSSVDIQELERKRAEFLKQREEADRQALEISAQIKELEKNQPIVLMVEEMVAGKTLKIRGAYDDRLVAMFRKLPGRWWNSAETVNVIPVEQHTLLKQEIEALPSGNGFRAVTLQYVEGVLEAITALENVPRFHVSLSTDAKKFYVKIGPRGNAMLVSNVPGAKWVKAHDHFEVPLLSAEKLCSNLAKEEAVSWETDAWSEAQREMSFRLTLDKIALMQDCELDVDLRGNQLKAFQKVGVKFLEATDGHGLLADQMGLGKTWQAIALMQLKGWRGVIICPASLKVNWAREIIKLTGERPLILSGAMPDQFDVKNLLIKKPRFVIINYDILGRKFEDGVEHILGDGSIAKSQVRERFPWVELLNAAGFDIAIEDEAHYVKNVESNRSKACMQITIPRHLPMSGTPVLNRAGELGPILHLVRPDLFPTPRTVSDVYTYDGVHTRNPEEFRAILKSIMIRRLKKDVIKELPAKNRVYHYHELSPKALRLYNKVLQGVYEVIADWNPGQAGSEKRVTSILAQIMRLKQVSAIDKCDHVADLAVEISDSASEGGHEKVIIFSQFKPVLKGIARRLGHEALLFTGDVDRDTRTALADQFQNDPKIKYLCATWQTAGEGLNLQAAGFVVFADLFWTPASHEQCEDRAYGRLSDPHPIDAYYVIAEDTIEEWIQTLLAKKMTIIEATVEGMDVDRSESVANDIMTMLKEEALKKGFGGK